MFSVEEVGGTAGDVTITAAANREARDSYIISVRVRQESFYSSISSVTECPN